MAIGVLLANVGKKRVCAGSPRPADSTQRHLPLRIGTPPLATGVGPTQPDGVAELRAAQHGRGEESLRSERPARTPEWTTAIAIGAPGFIAEVKADLGVAARRRDIDVSGTTGVPGETEAAYRHEIAAENGRLSVKKSHLWNEA
jgi:hypothetical protein